MVKVWSSEILPILQFGGIHGQQVGAGYNRDAFL